MNVDTLLARQMELHTSVRHPPKSASELARFRVQMHHYQVFLSKLKWMSQQLSAEVDTTFQCLMYISLGGVVSFDKQHQDGSVPMHQAKVLARDAAIQLEPKLRALIPHEELMVYVGASKDLRATLRVKVEDSNDLVTAEKSVNEAVEYLDFIYTESSGDPGTMFAFYMVEDEQSLNRLLDASATSPMGSSAQGLGSTFSGTMTQSSPTTDAPLDPIPPVGSLVGAVRRLCDRAGDPKGKPTDRITAAQTVAKWMREISNNDFSAVRAGLMASLDEGVAALVVEKRSVLCRLGCDLVSSVMTHLTGNPQLFGEGDAVAAVLSRWVTALCRGIYVTVATIAMATDYALRDVFTQSHGSVCLTKALIGAFERGTQTELRRKSLGYMCLSVCAAEGDRRTLLQLARLLIPISQRYVTVGDSPSRKMARALVAVLRVVTGEPVPIEDVRTERLVEVERGRVHETVQDGPRALEKFIFETDNFVSSMKRPGAGSATRQLATPADNTPLRTSAAHSEVNKYPRVTQTTASGSNGGSPHDGKSRDRRGPSHVMHDTASVDAVRVYETNDSLVARRRSDEVESEPGLSYPSLSTQHRSVEAAAAGAPGSRGAAVFPRVPVATGPSKGADHGSCSVDAHSRPSQARKPTSFGDGALHSGDSSPEGGSGSCLPRMSPSLQRKIAQSKPKGGLD